MAKEPSFDVVSEVDMQEVSNAAGNQKVHRRHRFAIIIDAHIKGFDFFRVICHEHRLLKILFSQIARRKWRFSISM